MVDLNPHDTEGTGKAVLGGDATMNQRSDGCFGGHGLFMTAPDYLKVLQSLLLNDGKVLKRETVNNMFEDHLTPESNAAHQAALQGPVGVHLACGIDPNSKVGYGLSGILTLESVDGWYGNRTLTWGGGMTFSWFCDVSSYDGPQTAAGGRQGFNPVPVSPLSPHHLSDVFTEAERSVWCLCDTISLADGL
jgi:CubicO group peptidase (beta-lactamase class C family)